jgi:hypothetical protein
MTWIISKPTSAEESDTPQLAVDQGRQGWLFWQKTEM